MERLPRTLQRDATFQGARRQRHLEVEPVQPHVPKRVAHRIPRRDPLTGVTHLSGRLEAASGAPLPQRRSHLLEEHAPVDVPSQLGLWRFRQPRPQVVQRPLAERYALFARVVVVVDPDVDDVHVPKLADGAPQVRGGVELRQSPRALALADDGVVDLLLKVVQLDPRGVRQHHLGARSIVGLLVNQVARLSEYFDPQHVDASELYSLNAVLSLPFIRAVSTRHRSPGPRSLRCRLPPLLWESEFDVVESRIVSSI